jgi:uncharacterized membrane protein
VTIRRFEQPLGPADLAEYPGDGRARELVRLGPCAGGLALIGLLVTVRGLWIAQLLLVPLLVVVPGVVLLRGLRVPGRAVASFPVYVPVASLVVLLASGLTVDWIGLLSGDTEPLRAGPLLTGLEVICFSLLASSARAPATVAIPWHKLAGRANLAWPLVLPLVAAVGALRLDAGHGGAVALIAAFTVIFLVFAMAMAPRLAPAKLAVALYAIGLAIMWSFSLRGSLVYGFDIASEYYVMHQTALTGVWYTYHPGDAYGAMLSITVLPAELSALSGVAGLLAFKIVYPALFALFPVAIFGLARKILPRRWAFAAGAFVAVQSTFAQGLPALARQEIALLFFVALSAAMLDPRLPRRTQWALVSLLGVALAVSHYSTTYLAIGLTGLLLLLQWAVSRIRPIQPFSGAVAIAFAALTLGALWWYLPVTHSSSDITQFMGTLRAQGLDLLPNQAQGEGLLSGYLQGNAVTPIQAGRYAQLIHQYYAQNIHYVVPFQDASNHLYALHDSSPPTPVPAQPLATGIALAELTVQQLANLLGVVGAAQMVLRRRTTSAITRQVGLFAAATLSVLVIIRLSGTVATEYNQERALIQAQVFLAISLCWSIFGLTRWLTGLRTIIATAATAGVALLLMNTTGVVAAVEGQKSVNLANSGEDFERFYMTPPELASARWLGKHVTEGQLVYADRYGQLRLAAEDRITKGLLTDITPMTLDQNAWIYASRTNIVERRTRNLYREFFASYSFPIDFISTHYNTVYTNGSSEVFHR